MRKPVVYLFPPRPLPQVAVSVRLVPQWSFTHIYPPVERKREPDGRQAISWTVSASPDGTLVEHGTALELAYLFWEAAATHNAAPPSPPLSPADEFALASTSPSPSPSHEYFDPAAPLLDPSSPTAVLLPFAALLPYLDGALQRLTLHTAARTDFVTYWLPLLAKQPFVALRFLPQPVYERAAELVVRPTPDVVTRVMMLFRGVPAAEAESDVWAAARGRVGEVDWAAVVGVKPWATDKARFRVLEWGAMEVL
uniref:Rho-GAP domain-containing protein n=1 Tax=Ganoderma boninense TaxID=34458 RepID=A0A5K1K3F0_9APHY|nr:Rho-GAP domain-containing protein [Ganoderma boninense]